jgi:hypothetical protein
MIKTILNILKWIVLLSLLGTALAFIFDIFGIINTSLIVSSLAQILLINIPITILTAYPNVWLLFGYFFFKGVVGFSINILKRRN